MGIKDILRESEDNRHEREQTEELIRQILKLLERACKDHREARRTGTYPLNAELIVNKLVDVLRNHGYNAAPEGGTRFLDSSIFGLDEEGRTDEFRD